MKLKKRIRAAYEILFKNRPVYEETHGYKFDPRPGESSIYGTKVIPCSKRPINIACSKCQESEEGGEDGE